jgi:hypothetical protein
MRQSVAFVTLLAAAAAACGDDSPGGIDAPGGGGWQLLGSQRPSSLLAVWAPSTDNVWIVGGREGIGGAPTVWHLDGSGWNKLDSGQLNVDLWQVFGFADGTVFLGGSNGTILRYRDGVFTKIPTPTTDIVFGLWGSSSDDVWAVGGQTNGRAFVWRYQGTAFEVVPGVPTDLATSGTVWKVVGRAANDIWMSCSRGIVLHWDGQALASQTIGTFGNSESLFSIGCNSARCVTAGTNLANGVLYENDGTGWVSRVPSGDGPVWRGVTPTGDHTYVVGAFGAVIRYTDGAWISDPHGLTTETFHAAWSDDQGNLFAVGGKFDRAPTIDGMVLFKGSQPLPSLP